MISIKFESAALPADTFQILKMDGEEEISHLFRFELQLISRDPNIDFKSVLRANAHIAIETQDNTRYLHGMLSEFEQFGEWQSGVYEYRAVVVPRLWIMSQSTQNQIFQEQTVPQIIESELSSIQTKGLHPLVLAGLSVDDYEIYTIEDYDEKEREYVVQYKETDLNFISRLMEHEGIYYYFEHDEHREKLVITDSMATEEIAGDSYAEFMTEVATARYDRNVVYKLSRSQKQIPSSVMVTDFNYREPSVPMQSDDFSVSKDGIGFVTEFGAHFKASDLGQKLANIRAQEFRCRENLFAGESNIAAFCCGGLYSLGQHFRAEYNQTYMITKVEHHASQEIESWGNVGNTNYRNRFNCIPSGLTYRPERLTPKPKLYGIMNGTIDSEQDLGRADLDEFGRYKVKMPFDMAGAAPGMASRRIRMAQPYGGSGDGGGGMGMSFPLLKGTEVIWTCIDGDIDRPIITGVVPNPLQPSVTNTQNATSNVIKTSSGITMGFHDGAGSAGSSASGGNGSLASQQQNQKIAPVAQTVVKGCTPSVSSAVITPPPAGHSAMHQIVRQQQMINNRIDLNGQTNVDAKQWLVGLAYATGGDVNDITREDKDVYLRLGKASAFESDIGDLWGAHGWLDYTDGDHNSITKGDRTDYTDGTHTVKNNNSTYSYKLAAATSYAITADNSHSIGLKTSSALGASVSASAGLNVAFKTAIDFSFSTAATFSYALGPTFTSASNINLEADKTVSIKVDPDDTPGETMLEETIPEAAIGIAAGSSALTALIALGGKYDGGAGWNRVADVHSGLLVTAGALVAAKAASVMRKNKKDNTGDEPATSLDMDATSAIIQANGGDANDKGLIALKAKTSFAQDDKEAVMIKLAKEGTTKNEIVLQCGKQTADTGSYINMDDDTLFAAYGKAYIEIKNDKIEFTVDTVTMTLDAKGLTLATKDIIVTGGDVKAEKGEIKSKTGTISGAFEAASAKI